MRTIRPIFVRRTPAARRAARERLTMHSQRQDASALIRRIKLGPAGR